jgi:hypothetical protein
MTNDRGEGWRIGIKNVSMYCGIRKPVGQIKHLLLQRQISRKPYSQKYTVSGKRIE